MGMEGSSDGYYTVVCNYGRLDGLYRVYKKKSNPTLKSSSAFIT